MEMLQGMTGSALSSAGASDTERRRFANGMMSIYMHVEHFQRTTGSTTEVRNTLNFIERSTSQAAEVLIPGEKELAYAAERRAGGLPLARQTWDDIVGKASAIGLSDARVEYSLRAIT